MVEWYDKYAGIDNIPNVMQQLTQDLLADLNRQLESKIKFCLYGHGFDTSKDDFKRLSIVPKQHFDDNDELYLDGILVIKWGKFSFKQDGLKLIGSFEYLEV